MVDYKNGKIYKLYSSQTTDIYIGSTTQELKARLKEHRCKYRLYNNNKYRYTTSFDIIKYEDCKIELIENCNCNDKKELLDREYHYIRTLNCINKNIPGAILRLGIKEYKRIYDNEYRQNNKDKERIKKKRYYEKHKEKLAAKAKEYRARKKLEALTLDINN